MRFVAEITESACHGTPLTADTFRRFSSAAMPYGDIPLSPDRNAPTTVILGMWFGILRMFGRFPNTPSQRPR